MFENKSKKNGKARKVSKYGNKYGTAAGSGEPGSSLYGMKNFKSPVVDQLDANSGNTGKIYSVKSNTVKPIDRSNVQKHNTEESNKVQSGDIRSDGKKSNTAENIESSDLLNKISASKTRDRAAKNVSYTASKTRDRVTKTVSDIVNNSIKDDSVAEEKKKDLPKSGQDVVKSVLEDSPDESNLSVFERHDLFYEKNSEPLIPGKKKKSSEKNKKKSNDEKGKQMKKSAPPPNKTTQEDKKAEKKNTPVTDNAADDKKSEEKPTVKNISVKSFKKGMDTPSYEKYIASVSGGASGQYKIPVAAFCVLAALVLLYAIFRVPISKIGMNTAARYGIKENSGILVNNTDITTLSNGKLKQLLGNGKVNYDDKLVTIKSTDNSFYIDYSFDEFDVVYDVEGTLKRASEFAKNNQSDNWWREVKALEGDNSVNFDVIHYNKSKLNSSIMAIAKQVCSPAVDASAKVVDGQFQVTPSSVGYSIDTESIFKQVDRIITERNFGQVVTFQINVVKPKFNEANFSDIDNMIGSWSSEYSDSDENRVQNLKTACSKLNGIIVYPNEQFSVNAHFLPFTENNGWKNAGTIVDGKIEDSIGGGMCQVSSALYDALLEAEIDIVERHNHSLKVNYADYGMDATLAGDFLDLKFKNDTGAPIYIESFLTDSSVVVNIYGKELHGDGHKIEFESQLVSSTDPDEPIIEYDDTLPKGTERILVYPLKGKVYQLYKNVYENGELVETVPVNISNYLPRREEKVVGTMVSSESDENSENLSLDDDAN